MRAQAVPAPKHGEEIRGERRPEDRVGLVDGDHAWRTEWLQDLPLHVARAVLRVREPGIPQLVDAIGQLQLFGDRGGEAAEEQVGVRL